MKSAFTSAGSAMHFESGSRPCRCRRCRPLDDGDVTNSVVLNLQLASLAVKVLSASDFPPMIAQR